VTSLRNQDGGQISENFQVKVNDFDELLVLCGRGFFEPENSKNQHLLFTK